MRGANSLKVIGKGLITLKAEAEGEVHTITSVQDVVKLWKAGAKGKIVMVDDAGVTYLSPILPKLAGIVCKSGGLGSHLAIVSREFSIPALMGTEINCQEELHGRRVKIQPDKGNSGVLMLYD